ncbi:hypothetical protein BH11PLA1_BH11PLA1_11300 [soil metagenome]
MHMDTRNLSVGFVSLALLTGAGALAFLAFAQPAAQPPAKAPEKAGEEAGEEVIDLAKAPEAVRTAALKLVGASGEKAIKKVIKEEDEGVYTYEIEFTADGVECSAALSTAGDLLELEKATTEAKLPAAAMAALKKDYPKATFAKPFAVTKMYYEIQMVIDGKTREVKVDAAGNIEGWPKGAGKDQKDAKGEGYGKGEKSEKGEKHEGKKGEKEKDDDND